MSHSISREATMRRITSLVLSALAASVLVVTAVSGVRAAGTYPVPLQIGGILPGTMTYAMLPFADVQDPYFQVGALGVLSGQLKGLGQSNVFIFHRPIPAAGATDPMTLRDGHFFIVAANGDRINGRYEGTVVPGAEPNQLVASMSWVIGGGTGRFQHATGTIDATAHVTVPADPWALEWSATLVLDGTVSY
jgi:hypothetical protein